MGVPAARTVAGVLALSLSAISGGGCSEDTQDDRCGSYLRFRAECTPSCASPAQCGDLEPLTSQEATDLDLVGFDTCLECLDDEALLGSCRDCELAPDGLSCRTLLADWLSLSCLQPESP